MPRYSWLTAPDGKVSVNVGDGGSASFISLGPSQAAVVDAVMARWEPLCAKHSVRTGVPKSWLLAMIYRESGGNPRIRNNHDDPPGLGLMQITATALYRGLTQEQVLDPDTNIRIGSNLVASLRKIVDDLPAVASMYNAGGTAKGPHVSSIDPFGYVCTTGHIEAVVRASNYIISCGHHALDTPEPGELSDEDRAHVLAVLAESSQRLVADALADTEPDPGAAPTTPPAA